MIKDVGIHCSVKHVTYIDREWYDKEFVRLKETIDEMNAIFSEMCEDFLIKGGKMLKVSRKRIDQNRKDKRVNNEELTPEQKQENNRVEGKRKLQGTYIGNFFVVPIERLRIFDIQEHKRTEVGLRIKVYTRMNKKKYKCVELDLLNETLANPKWIDPNFLDYDFYLYRDNLYPYLLRAIKLATRLLEEDDEKLIFNDAVGWVERLRVHEDGSVGYLKDDGYSIWSESGIVKTELDPMKLDVVKFLKAVRNYANKSQFLMIDDKMDVNADLQEEFVGWENETKWFFDYVRLKSSVTNILQQSGEMDFTLDKPFYVFLSMHGILDNEGKEEKNFRPDKKIPKSKNQRAFTLDKSRVDEFLLKNQNIIE
ncbi:hypothetical protein [Paenibacillus sp. sgz302251]|uniref:hypothetical protein n=1 Tax=Paenibacillus sp. sgz302251 TaxID=3414493 RepID=UPI003C7E55FE